jgi:hypothetical protein
MIEKGVYSPYREIERLTKENDIKDKKITELLEQLGAAQDEGDELKEADLITKIVEHSVKLGVDVAKNVELVLGRIYRGSTKFAEHFKWLEDYIANTSSAGDILKAIAELNETLKKAANKPTTQTNFTLELVQKKETNIEHNYENGAQHNDHSRRLTLNSDDADKGKLLE